LPSSFPFIYAGSIDAGIGCTQLNALLSSMNLPTISDSSFREIEQVVGEKIVDLADDSCRKAILAEKELTMRFYLHRPLYLFDNFVIFLGNMNCFNVTSAKKS
jgi:hypothetical protein